MEMGSTFWLPNITEWRQEQENPHLKSANHSNVASEILSSIPNSVGQEASFPLGKM
jgi:hypothetical protein